MLALFLVLSAAAATAFWIRSYWASDTVSFEASTHSTSLKTLAGDIIWTKIEMPIPSPAGWEFETVRGRSPATEIVNQAGLWQHNSPFYRYADVTPTNRAFRIKTAAVPFWWWDLPLILFAFAISLLLVTTRPTRGAGMHSSNLKNARVL
jgi:hypothetical protein